MTKLKSVKYLGKTITFSKEYAQNVGYGTIGSNRVDAYVGNVRVGTGSTKPEALKQAKREMRNMIKR